MSWIKKLLSHFKSIEKIEKEENTIPNQNSSQIETRMTYQYPKTPFRFPLIPDPPKKTDSNDKKVGRTMVQTGIEPLDEFPQNELDEEILSKQRRQEKIKKPFQITEVPSPVYGFQRQEKRRAKVEIANSEIETAAAIEPQHPPFEQEQVEEVAQVNLESNEKTLETEKEVKQEPIINSSELKEDTDQQPERKDVSNEERTRREKPVRSALPFNVLMLKSDRRKWQERQKASRREEPVAQETKGISEPRIQKEERIRELPSTRTDKELIKQTEKVIRNQGGNESYIFPNLHLLHPPVRKLDNQRWLMEQKELLNETLKNFNVNAHVVHFNQGPAVTRFEVQPEPGVKVNKITNLSDDIKLSMAAKDIRIEAPIPGKRSVGIEIPNRESRPVQISEILRDTQFINNKSVLTAALGLDVSGKPVVTDLQKMPHGLIAGATGSGKSVCVNSILISLLYKARPDELKLLLIDPKMVELAPYNQIPHLVSPVITDVKAATAALKWTVDEMERRYELFSHTGVRNIGRFNELAESEGKFSDKLPYIVVVIDELADLMMMAPQDVEESISRIAQKARACGIHLLIATQRPSVDVITGLIKANIPTRIAFSVSSQVDSRTIIDMSGAEKLLGRGDMLFLDSGSSKPVRLQGTFVSDEEIDRVIEHVRTQGEPNYLFQQEELLKKAQIQEEDELYSEACEFVVSQGSASTSLLQRQFRIGYNRAARLIDMMEQQGIISEARGSKPRDVLITEMELETLQQ